MAIKIETVNILKRYFEGVVKRADHHAPNVQDILYKLLGIVVLKKDDDSDIEVREAGEGATGNVLWVTINGNRYAFRYEHKDGTIELRENSIKGPTLLKIDNNTSTQTILSALL